jgi:GTP-binding protein
MKQVAEVNNELDGRHVPAPLVAIIGRPNVGKSTLFNRIVGSRRSIVGDLPGITRDRIYAEAEWQGRPFRLVDTGGMVPDDAAEIPAGIIRQAQVAIEEASLLLLVVDVRAGVSSLDQELARRLRSARKPVYIVANKSDTANVATLATEFYELGYDAVYPVSAEHGIGLGELLDAVVEGIPVSSSASEREGEIQVAIIGRPNVGKSSLINRLVGQERVIVSAIPGTTRDAIDTLIETVGTDGSRIEMRVIDTAGIRRKGKTEEMAEKLSVVMARKHIARADVVLLVLDAMEPATALDATIGGYAHEAGKSVIIVVNKWDVIEKDSDTTKAFERRVREGMKFLDYAPVVFVSALKGQRVTRIPSLVARADRARRLRIPTGELNQFFRRFLEQPKVATSANSRLKVLYLTQAGIRPPTFVLFTSGRKAKLHFSYERYLVNRLRESFDFWATPIRILQRNRK